MGFWEWMGFENPRDSPKTEQPKEGLPQVTDNVRDSGQTFVLWALKEGIVDGDVITYMTNFGVKLVSTGNSRTLMAFIGFRKCNPNKTVEILMDGWQVNGLCIRYHRENKKEKTANTLAIRKKKALEREEQKKNA